LNDRDLRKVLEVFDACMECWRPDPERCKYRPVRKKLGLGECMVYEAKQSYKKFKEMKKK